jgi:hypothetical protein
MSITYRKDRVVFSDMAEGEDAESLLEWLDKHPKGKIDLSGCTHLHPATLQVLMASNCSIFAKPKDKLLADWIDSALHLV